MSVIRSLKSKTNDDYYFGFNYGSRQEISAYLSQIIKNPSNVVNWNSTDTSRYYEYLRNCIGFLILFQSNILLILAYLAFSASNDPTRIPTSTPQPIYYDTTFYVSSTNAELIYNNNIVDLMKQNIIERVSFYSLNINQLSVL